MPLHSGLRRLIAGRHSDVALVALAAALIVVFAASNVKHPPLAEATPSRSFDRSDDVIAMEAAYLARPNARTARDYARAALRAGVYGDVLDVFGRPEGTPLPPNEALKVTAEARFRLRSYDAALSDIATLRAKGVEDPAANLLDARIRHAKGAFDTDELTELLRPALRAGGSLAGEAWLFRSRLALDVGDEALAVAAANRAEEAGAHEERVRAMRIEIALRRKDFHQAVSLAGVSERSDDRKPSPALTHARSLLDLARGDAASAVARVDQIEAWLAAQPRGDLFAGVVRARAGQAAQGRTLVAKYALDAPGDWAAHAVLLEEFAELGQRDVAYLNETYAAARAFEQAVRQARLDAAANILARVPASSGSLDETRIESGVAAVTAGVLGENFKTFKAYRTLMDGGEGAIDASAPDGPLADYLRGVRRLSETDDEAGAAQRLERAAALAPGFAAPRVALATLAWRRGAEEDAIAKLKDFSLNGRGIDVTVPIARAFEAFGSQSDALAALQSMPAAELATSPDASFQFARLAAPTAPELETVLRAAARNWSDKKALGKMYMAATRYDAAARAFKLAMTADPADAPARAGYLNAMTALGRRSQAEAAIKALSERSRRAQTPGSEPSAAHEVAASSTPQL